MNYKEAKSKADELVNANPEHRQVYFESLIKRIIFKRLNPDMEMNIRNIFAKYNTSGHYKRYATQGIIKALNDAADISEKRRKDGEPKTSNKKIKFGNTKADITIQHKRLPGSAFSNR